MSELKCITEAKEQLAEVLVQFCQVATAQKENVTDLAKAMNGKILINLSYDMDNIIDYLELFDPDFDKEAWAEEWKVTHPEVYKKLENA